MRSLITFVAVVAVLVNQGVDAGRCVQFSSSCTDCAKESHCGWNVGMRKCMAGDSGGPYIGSANQGWDYSVDACGNAGPTNKACMKYSSCTSCLKNGQECGWDQRVMKCLLGNSTGPTNSAAYGPSGAAVEWAWGQASTQCPTPPDCSKYTTCSKCTLSPTGDCGWNAFTSTCVEGTASGPAGQQLANSDDWKWALAQCPTAQPTQKKNTTVNSAAACAKHTSCYNCTRSLAGNCGWTGKRCLFGTKVGPMDPLQSTNFWGWTADFCVLTETWNNDGAYIQKRTDNVSCSVKLTQCSVITNCMDCVNNDQGCNWDKGLTKCMQEGMQRDSDDIAYSGSPRSCFYKNSVCSEHGDCGDCTTDASGECGWDADMGKCKQGTKYGPTSGYARRWFFIKGQCPAISGCESLLTCASCFNNGNTHLVTNSSALVPPQIKCMWSFTGGEFTCTQVDHFPSSAFDTWGFGQCPSLDESGEGDAVTECFADNCFDCSTMAHCGWDANAKMCKSGSVLGPTNGDLPRMWDFTPDQCGTEQCGGSCQSNPDCFSCSQALNCVWNTGDDGSPTECVPGNGNGPFRPKHSAQAVVNYGLATNTYVTSYDQCPDYTECSLIFDCRSCVQTYGCGWQTQGNGCMSGDSNGPYNNVWADEGTWITSTSGCPASWTFRWSANSISLWLTVSAVAATTVFIVFILLYRRRLRLRRLAAAQAAPIQATATGAPTTGLLATGAQPVNGTVYGATSQVATTGGAAAASPAAPGGPAFPYGQACYDVGGDANSIHSMPLMEDIED